MKIWKRSRRKRKQWALTTSLGLLCVLFLTVFGHHDSRFEFYNPTQHLFTRVTTSTNPLIKDHARFWRSLYGLILNNDPQCHNLPDLVVPQRLDINFDKDHSHPRPDVLWLDSADVERLKTAHANFVQDLRRLPLKMAYDEGTRGIVMTASDSLLTILTISLRLLRQTRSQLPVEVFLNRPSALSQAYCTRIFPSLNTKCVYLSDIFWAAGTSVELNAFQFKIFSLLFSSFEDVLLLDSDAWPVSSPDHLFTSIPFIDTGLIFWPDFWYPSESPYYFEIAKIMRIPEISHRPSTESGEMLYSKSKHAASLMLAAYYNYHGPSYYYILQSQGAPGQGDKETFPLAATAMEEDFYFVHHFVATLGRHDSTDGYVGSAMVQFDPVMDYFNEQHRQNIPQDATSYEQKYTPKPLFVHANVPKFDPQTIFHPDGYKGPTHDSNGTAVRCWMSQRDTIEAFGYDVEERFWRTIQEVACVDVLGLGGLDAAKYTDRRARQVALETDRFVCEKVRDYVKEVFG